MALYYTAHLEWFHQYLGGGGAAVDVRSSSCATRSSTAAPASVLKSRYQPRIQAGRIKAQRRCRSDKILQTRGRRRPRWRRGSVSRFRRGAVGAMGEPADLAPPAVPLVAIRRLRARSDRSRTRRQVGLAAGTAAGCSEDIMDVSKSPTCPGRRSPRCAAGRDQFIPGHIPVGAGGHPNRMPQRHISRGQLGEFVIPPWPLTRKIRVKPSVISDSTRSQSTRK